MSEDAEYRARAKRRKAGVQAEWAAPFGRAIGQAILDGTTDEELEAFRQSILRTLPARKERPAA